MKVINPLKINDININSFLKVILAIQLAMFGVIGLDAIGLQIPILRQLTGVIYLIFVPGIILLRILKLHELSNIETLLYTVGLSIATLMFTGLFMNTIYPFFDIFEPISITPLIITISIVVLILCIVCYVMDKDFSEIPFIDVRDILSPPALFLCLIPFMSIFGTYLINIHRNNIILMFLIVIIALTVVLIGFDKFIPKRLYPLAVLMITIAILFSRSLIGMYIPSWDVHQEYHLANLVMINTSWDPTLPSNVNAMLSITILAPMYSTLLNMDLTWVFKIIYPILYSFMVLGLYHVFQKQTDNKTAFLACFFFTSIFIFTELVELARQEIAELFLVLLILLMIDKNMNKTKRVFLAMVFGFSIVVSHYGISYVYMFCLVFAWLTLLSMDNLIIKKFWKTLHFRLGKVTNSITNLRNIGCDGTISVTFVLLYIVFAITWYMHTSSSSVFNAIIHIGDHIASSIFTDFLNPEATQGLSVLLSEPAPPLHKVSKFLHHVTQFFIVVGIFKLVLRRKEMKFHDEYVAFSAINFMICIASLTVPYFSGALNITRIYHITLIFLAPLCVIGGVTVFRILLKIFKFISHKFFNSHSKLSGNNYITLQTVLKFLSIFFMIFFLFNSGFIYEITGEISYPLNMDHPEKSNEVTGEDTGYAYACDVFSAGWASKNIKDKNKIYADYIANEMVLVSYGMQPLACRHAHDLSNVSKIDTASYIYLRHTNVVKGIIMRGSEITWNTTDVLPPYRRLYVIYSNGNSEIYYYE